MISVAVVGCTGIVGQQTIANLAQHPWFRITKLAASAKSANKTYVDALADATGSVKWFLSEPIPEAVRRMQVEDADMLDVKNVDLVFSAVETGAAKVLEPRFAQHVPVISNASAFRYEADTPILVGGVNESHANLLKTQQVQRGWRGFVAPKPNCTTAGLVVALKPILDVYGIERVAMCSFQAISGAGRTPGVLGLDIIDNIVPFIPGEEEKAEQEPLKILGKLEGTRIINAPFVVSATCTRVPVTDGHVVVASIETKRQMDIADLKALYSNFGREFLAHHLPSSPKELVKVLEDPYHPQPKLHRDLGDGMTVTVGRIRPEPLFGNRGVKLVCLSHNTKFGASKGSIQSAEYLAKNVLNWVPGASPKFLAG